MCIKNEKVSGVDKLREIIKKEQDKLELLARKEIDLQDFKVYVNGCTGNIWSIIEFLKVWE